MNEKIKAKNKAFQAVAIIVLGTMSILVLFPFLLLVISSFTEENTLMLNGYSLFPAKMNLEAYKYIFMGANTIIKSYGLSILVTIIGTVMNLAMTSLMAYPLSRKDFRGKTVFTFIVFFTMLFNGGIVPQYMMWSSIFHIKNTLIAYVVPNLLMTAFNVLLIKNFYTTNVPFEIIESGKMDGAGEWRVFYRLVIPMATPILAAIGLLIALAYWNDWVNGLYYISNPKLYTFQNLLNRMIQQIDYLTSGDAAFVLSGQNIVVPSMSVRMAIASLGVVPIMMIYPFFQKYFAKGLAMGAVKG